MTVTEKVAYLKGLVEGLGIDDSTKEGRVLRAVVDVLDDMALTVSDTEDSVAELSEQVDAIDEDLEDLEKDFYGEDEDEEMDTYRVTCPKCGEDVEFDDDILSEGEVVCPHCGEKLEFDFGEECDCGHDHGDAEDDKD